MKLKLYGLLLALNAITTQAQHAHRLDPEMTGAEYRQLFANMEQSPNFHRRIVADPLHMILELGKRNLDWIELINSKRDANHQLQLTTPETTQAHPIDAPAESNRTLIMNNLETLKNSMPSAMTQIVFSNGSLPDNPPVDDITFINNARAINGIYEAASRWLLEEPYLDEMKSFAQFDIRGYYFLQQEKDLHYKLNHWQALDDTTKKNYSEWLISECNNTTNDAVLCEQFLINAEQEHQVLQYHQSYVAKSAQIFNGFFELQNPRPEVIWNAENANTMIIPFTLPDNQEVQNWLKTNVEDEFHLNQWSLQIDFSHADNLAKIIFEPGATPHVNELGGDTITMDANRNLNDYQVAWTIRHEFAHVLGFPDCYVEFYDARHEVMVNYQIDTSNLMCSRRGHLQPQHHEQLKKHYYKP